MTGEEFRANYHLQETVTEGPVVTYRARDFAKSEVFVHFLVGKDPGDGASLVDDLPELDEARAKQVRLFVEVDSVPVLVTEPLEGFTNLKDWVGRGVEDGVESPAPGEYTRLFQVPAEADAGKTSPEASSTPHPEPTGDPADLLGVRDILDDPGQDRTEKHSEEPLPDSTGAAPGEETEEGEQPSKGTGPTARGAAEKGKEDSEAPGAYTQLFRMPGGPKPEEDPPPSSTPSDPGPPRTPPPPDQVEAVPEGRSPVQETQPGSEPPPPESPSHPETVRQPPPTEASPAPQPPPPPPTPQDPPDAREEPGAYTRFFGKAGPGGHPGSEEQPPKHRGAARREESAGPDEGPSWERWRDTPGAAGKHIPSDDYLGRLGGVARRYQEPDPPPSSRPGPGGGGAWSAPESREPERAPPEPSRPWGAQDQGAPEGRPFPEPNEQPSPGKTGKSSGPSVWVTVVGLLLVVATIVTLVMILTRME